MTDQFEFNNPIMPGSIWDKDSDFWVQIVSPVGNGPKGDKGDRGENLAYKNLSPSERAEIYRRVAYLNNRIEDAVYTTTEASTSYIDIPFEDYDEYDTIWVFVDGKMLFEPEDYSIVGNRIVFNTPVSPAGTDIGVRALRYSIPNGNKNTSFLMPATVYATLDNSGGRASVSADIVGDDGLWFDFQNIGANTYNNVAEMQADQSIKAGNICHTLGYHELEDGGGSWYKVYNTSPDNSVVVELANGLFAKLIDDTKNPCCYGADKTGQRYSDDAFAECIAFNKGSNIDISPGKYRFANKLSIPAVPEDRVDIDFNGSVLMFESTDYCFDIGEDITQEFATAINQCVITNFLIINNVVQNQGCAVYFRTYSKSFRMNNFEIIGKFSRGVIIGDNTVTRPGDVYIDNFSMNLQDSKLSNIGFEIFATDNKISNGAMCGITTAFMLYGVSLYLMNVHAIPSGIDNNNINNYDLVYLRYGTFVRNGVSVSGNDAILSNCYCDTFKSFLKTDSSSVCVASFVQCAFYSYLSNQIQIAFDVYNAVDQALKIVCCEISFTNKNENMGIYMNRANSGGQWNAKVNSIVISPFMNGENNNILPDPLLCHRDFVFPYSVADPNNYNDPVWMQPNTWYQVAYLNAITQIVELLITASDMRYWRGLIGVHSDGSAVIKTIDRDRLDVAAKLAPNTNNNVPGLIVLLKTDAITSWVKVTSNTRCLGALHPTGRIIATLRTDTPDYTEA